MGLMKKYCCFVLFLSIAAGLHSFADAAFVMNFTIRQVDSGVRVDASGDFNLDGLTQGSNQSQNPQMRAAYDGNFNPIIRVGGGTPSTSSRVLDVFVEAVSGPQLGDNSLNFGTSTTSVSSIVAGSLSGSRVGFNFGSPNPPSLDSSTNGVIILPQLSSLPSSLTLNGSATFQGSLSDFGLTVGTVKTYEYRADANSAVLGTVIVSVIPEPSSFGLWLVGSTVVSSVVRFRRRA